MVYSYTVDEAVCMGDGSGWSYRRYFPHYIVHSLNQAVFTQTNSDVYFVSNFKQCKLVQEHIMSKVSDKVIKVDINDIPSAGNRSANFFNASLDVFMGDSGSLWIASALRFFYLRDLMEQKGWQEFVHIEGDNMLYIDTATLAPHFRKNFGKALAVTPLEANRSAFTASALWVGSYEALREFTDFLYELAKKQTGLWLEYLNWLKPFACCKMQSGLLEDQFGRGLKPYKISEMTMMAFYHHHQKKRLEEAQSSKSEERSQRRRLSSAQDGGSGDREGGIQEHSQLKLLPVVPPYQYNSNKYTCNMSDFAQGGVEIPPFRAVEGDGADRVSLLKALVFDPNSYGQNLGGTNSKGGRNKNFKDASHVVGQAFRMNSCKVTLLCGNSPTLYPWTGINNPQEAEAEAGRGAGANATCYAAPYVKCGMDAAERSAALTQYRKEAREQVMREHPDKYPPPSPTSGQQGGIEDSERLAAVEASEELKTLMEEYAAQHFWRKETKWHPIYNLHIHAKRTQHYLSEKWPCSCETPDGAPRGRPHSVGWAPGQG